MIETELVEDRRVEVADVDGVFDDVVGEIIGLAVAEAGFHAGAGHPHAEAAWVVVAAIIVGLERALRIDRAAEFPAPDDKRVVEETATFEVSDETVGGTVGVFAECFDVLGEQVVVVPAAEENLSETHAAFGEAAGHETVVGEGAGLFGLGAVEVPRGSGLVGEIRELGHGGLHAEGEFVLGDAGVGLGVAHGFVELAIHVVDAVNHGATEVAVDAGRVAQVQDRITAGAECDRGVFGREKTGSPEAVGKRLDVARDGHLRGEHDEGRELVVDGAEAVGEPRAE